MTSKALLWSNNSDTVKRDRLIYIDICVSVYCKVQDERKDFATPNIFHQRHLPQPRLAELYKGIKTAWRRGGGFYFSGFAVV